MKPVWGTSPLQPAQVRLNHSSKELQTFKKKNQGLLIFRSIMPQSPKMQERNDAEILRNL